ncbi:MAG: acyl-CoA dehydrogenase family protein [Dehalococcoidia bacterium]
METQEIRKGGAFLLETTPPDELFTPEDFTEEHKMIIDTTESFVKNEVEPHIEKLEHKDFDLTRELMRKAGELGLLGSDIEEAYGGSELDSISHALILEYSAGSGSLGVTMSCHTGIGSMPLVFFGNKAQKEKYLPSLASGEKIGAYALTEPSAGTDALAIQTTAVLSQDGKYYTLNGAKQFITNGNMADIIFTYAKIDGDKMTAFILERDFEGVSTGVEEKKMGIRGSSTCSIFLDNARVPAENLLYELGKGHHVAFNILNLGRFTLGPGCVGMAKLALDSSVKYAKERVQFGKPICQFGLVKQKLGEMATRTYMAESMIYRTGGLIDRILATVDKTADDAGRRNAQCIAEYAMECSIVKIYTSEMIAYVADEAVQTFGGYGFVEEYPVERIYRDCRIFRLFEGTNEINRVIIVGSLMRKALKDEIPFFAAAAEAKGALRAMEPLLPATGDGILSYEQKLLDRAKKVFLYLANLAAQKYGMALDEQQEVLGLLADTATEIYAMESGLLRALKAIESVGEHNSKTRIEMVQLYVSDATARVGSYARQALAAMETDEALQEHLSLVGKALQFTPANGMRLRRSIADRIIEVERYIC